METLSVEALRALFSYDPEIGVLRWKVHRAANAAVGDEAGHLGDRGYRRVEVRGRSYRVHRVIWALTTGRWPVDQIDHRNRKKTDNRWCNLREATHHQNQRNRDAQRNNTSGCAGVDFHTSKNRWRASIRMSGKKLHLGYFQTKEAAIAARLAANARFYADFAASYLD